MDKNYYQKEHCMNLKYVCAINKCGFQISTSYIHVLREHSPTGEILLVLFGCKKKCLCMSVQVQLILTCMDTDSVRPVAVGLLIVSNVKDV